MFNQTIRVTLKDLKLFCSFYASICLIFHPEGLIRMEYINQVIYSYINQFKQESNCSVFPFCLFFPLSRADLF